MGLSGGLALSLVVLLIRGCLSATRHDDICGDYNGRKLYLELGHRGFLSARGVAPDLPTRGGIPSNVTSTHHQCGMEIVTCPSCVITIVFHSLNLSTCSQDGSCRCDYMWITEPPYETSGAPFCGIVKSPPTGSGDIGQGEWFGAFPRGYRDSVAVGYRSRTRTVSLSLLFASRHHHAFTLEYSSERNRQFLKGYRPNPAANATMGGVLSSPFFPSLYPRDLGAEHFITSPDPTARIRLLFSDFQLAASSIVEFYDWNGTRLEVSSGAQFRPPVVLSSGPSLLVRFYANGGTGLGYKATYSFLTGQIPENVLKPFTDCGGFVEDVGGAITMMEMVPPGDVRAYDCVWIVRPPKFRAHLKTHLYLRVAQFQDMGGSTELHVRQGTTSETPLLEVLRLPTPSATSPLRHHGSSRYRRHVSHPSDYNQRRTSRFFGWLPQHGETPHTNEAGASTTTEVTEPSGNMNGAAPRDSSHRAGSNAVEIPMEVALPWEITLPTTGAPSSPQALVASPVTDTPRSPPPRRRRPPPPVAARKQVGREHVLPLEVGFYVTLSGTFAHESRLSIVYTAFSYMDCFAGTDFLCKNHRCIPGRLTCDGFDHCGDASDEPPSCHTEGESGPMEGPGGIGMMGGMGTDNSIDRHWYSHTPNYYFPKMERYPDLKTATLVFIVSSLGLILLIAALIILLYRMGSRARQHRELQNRLQTISDLLGEYDGARIEEISTDDPPDYEAPPTYEDVVKGVNGPSSDCTSSSAMGPPVEDDCPITGKERVPERRRRARPRPASMTSASILHEDAPGSSVQASSCLLPGPPNTSSRSCQTTPVPDSPPPTYETALLRASHALNVSRANNLLHGSTSTPLFPVAQPHGSTPSTSSQIPGFASLPSSAPNSLPFMQTLPELPERFLRDSISDDGHSTYTNATLLEVGEDGGSRENLMTPASPTGASISSGEGNRLLSDENPEEEIANVSVEGGAEALPQSGTSTESNAATDVEQTGQVPQTVEGGASEGTSAETADELTRNQREGGSDSDEAAGGSQHVPKAKTVVERSGNKENKPTAYTESAKENLQKTPGVSNESIAVSKQEELKPTAESSPKGAIPRVTVDAHQETSGDASVPSTSSSVEPTPGSSREAAGNKVEGSPKNNAESKTKEDKPREGVDGRPNKTEGGGKEGDGIDNRKPAVKIVEGIVALPNPAAKELEECTVRVKEMVKRQESKVGKGSNEDLRKEAKDTGEEAIVAETEEIVEPVKEDSAEDEGSSGEGGTGPLPEEIVGGLVRGHIKLFQGLSINKEDEDGEARLVRRRVAMRGWRSVDVSCAERSLDE